MSDNVRIRTTPGGANKNINVTINQKFDFIEILSLKISQAEAYKRFCSDYGVVVGRVIVNSGVGVPNAKVSIFIPIDEVDLEDSDISGLYPYETVTDTDDEGIPYNLVPRNNRGKDECYTPIGTFPSKREIQDNPEMGDIYCQYYKFTTTTNESGDYMFFGVPVGTHFLHTNADLSDIGFLSQRPYDLIRDGADEKTFNSPTKFKNRNESSTINQLKTVTPMSVTVPPFWGDTEECSIGIARIDVNLATTIRPHAIFMGSLITDNDKHALSRNCIPRKKLGKMEELVTGNGRVEMIRKTNDNLIERFDVEGGEVIDSNGAWAYQIPMNSSYYVTAEDGTFVPSEDPTKGLPTKTRVRFRIGMDVQGDEGKLRRRARFLVPHNPTKWANNTVDGGVDFTFNETTRDENFTELSWNKIYTVKNHITRAQARGGAENRNFIGIKNVDDPKGRNPFPFNKLDNDINPLFTFLCLFVAIIARLVGFMNWIFVPLINIIIRLLNGVMKIICEVLWFIGKLVCKLEYVLSTCSSCKKSCRQDACLPYKKSDPTTHKTCPGDCEGNDCVCEDIFGYVPYITLGCSISDKDYAPRAYYGEPGRTIRDANHLAWLATYNQEDSETGLITPTPFHYITRQNITYLPLPITYTKKYATAVPDSDEGDHPCTVDQKIKLEGCDAGWTNCVALALADALDVFKFDFYNDWINGALYPFLLKHKIKKQGTGEERFCEVDCRSTTGVDNDKDGTGDNPCRNNKIVDTCTGAIPQGGGGLGILGITLLDKGVNTDERYEIENGYIKKYEDELYYSPVSRNGDHKLYATDIVNLGSVFECDWEGKPQFYQYLDDTTFNIPPLLPEYEVLTGDVSGKLMVSGFDSKLPNTGAPLAGFLPTTRLIGNITCFGLNTDSNSCNNLKRLCELGVGQDERRTDSSGNVTVPDNRITNVDVEQDFVRGIFKHLNTPGSTTIDSVLFDTTAGLYLNPPYSSFRVAGGINPSNTSFWNDKIWVYDNSFYFYFGLNKGNTALTKLKRKYFTDCLPEVDVDFFVIATTITEDGTSQAGTGAIIIEPSGGVGPYTYSWSGPIIPGSTTQFTSSNKDISGLYGGTYTVNVLDSLGRLTEASFIVPGPTPVSCNPQVTKTVQSFGASDGEIQISVADGLPPYIITFSNYDLTTASGTILGPAAAPVTLAAVGSHTFTGLAKGAYLVNVTDDGLPQTQCERILYVNEPPQLNVSIIKTDIKCHNDTDGTMSVAVTGGDAPYKFLWTAPSISTTETNATITNLGVDTYTVAVTDSNGAGQTVTVSDSISNPAALIMPTVIGTDGCLPGLGNIKVTVGGGGTPGTVGYNVNVSGGIENVNLDLIANSSGQADFNGLKDGAGSIYTSVDERYIITVTDANGCSISKKQAIYVPLAALNISLYNDGVLSTILTPTSVYGVNINDGIFETDALKPWGIQRYNVTWLVTRVVSSVVTPVHSSTSTLSSGVTSQDCPFALSLGDTVTVTVLDKSGNGICPKTENAYKGT